MIVCTFFYLQRPSLGIFNGCLINICYSKSRKRNSELIHLSDEREPKLLQKWPKVKRRCVQWQKGTGPQAVTFPQVHKHIGLGHWQAQLGSSQLPQSGCICLAKGGNDSICQDEIEQRSSEPSGAVTRCTSIWLECKQGMLSSSSTQWAPCQIHTLFAIFASLIGSAEGRGKRSAVHNDSHYVWCILSQD